MDLEKKLDEGLANIKTQIEEKTATFGEVKSAMETLKANFEEYKTNAETKSAETINAMQKHLDALDVKLQKRVASSMETKSFSGLLGEQLLKSKELLSDLADKKTRSAVIELKAAGDLDETAFAGVSLDSQITEVRGLRESAYQPIWLRNFMPNNSTTSGVIHYLKEEPWTGAAAVWDGTGTIETLTDKPGLNPNFDMVTETVLWIAGIVRVKREMLDDVAWLRGYLSRKLTTGRYGLFVAENAQILSTLQTNSVTYDGDKTNLVEAIYDAAFGQLRDNYHNPSVIIVNNRDLVSLIALNKAEGSGEYDLPVGTVVTTQAGLSIGGIPVVGIPDMEQGKFLVYDANETELVTRMNPEVRFFEEDRDNVAKNLITVRAEERILPIVYDETAVIYGEVAEQEEEVEEI